MRIDNLSAKQKSGHTFVDLAFDMKTETKSKNVSILNPDVAEGGDMGVAYDTTALRNSLENLLNTPVGSRYIERGFGTDVMKYIGEPVTDIIGEQIGREVADAINRWEPRLQIQRIYTVANPETLSFDLFISVTSQFVDNASIIVLANYSSSSGRFSFK